MKTVITIDRQTGSGGREIGKLLADELGIPFYDENLLQRAAKESGFCEEIFEHHDEKPTKSFLYSLVMSGGLSFAGSFTDIPLDHKVFLAQFDTIRKIADEGPAVIVGRCADYALDGYSDCFTVFIHAPEEDRAVRMVEKYSDLTPAKAHDQVAKEDKQRSSYYNYYTNKSWGAASSYDLTLDSSVLGLEGCVRIIKEALNVKQS